ncbi:helix-turn-helix domain-containing protein [Arsenophonus sp. aPb]|uniref:helix-turn-helix domain-containing protein n=1 Tax=Arsenophonus sp. aPb TaxID=3041619 RepID=UPI0024683545|nr:helix-turn-helix domain-containing protein [Arsenophonus sp. aPb]WGL98932.1 helix-turn-helix domain-containing protein [Arsenophonus sp. aPb]
MNKNDEQEVRRKLRILAHVDETKNVSKTCRYWGISRDTFYRWKKEYKTQGEVGLINSKPCPENPSIRVAFVIEEKILYLSLEYLMLRYWCPFTILKRKSFKYSARDDLSLAAQNFICSLLKTIT